ncbi:hypothetical protein [Lewinella cohaerens]|uniref:hypothetical protein n=1 Tax=Lewinella cohaerens TaxID=70995 RepID=UPI00035D9F04|nr:hypothetical protein [Lewinella cohaerens]
MLKDIPQQKVEDLAIAIVPPAESSEDDLWDVMIINLHEARIKSVMVTAKGYGEITGEKKETATFRYFIEEVGPLAIEKIEPIQPAVFELTNEYWVSFSLNGHLFDKKYIFVKGSISPENFTPIPFLNRKGILIR